MNSEYLHYLVINKILIKVDTYLHSIHVLMNILDFYCTVLQCWTTVLSEKTMSGDTSAALVGNRISCLNFSTFCQMSQIPTTWVEMEFARMQ